MSFWFKKRKKASEAAPMPKHPGEYAQDCNQSLLKDGRYDPTRVSSHENDVVKEVILASRKKYSRPYQGIGLAVETYSIIYKPRYILYEYIVQKYGHSSNAFDVLATAIAYKEKGAAYRHLSLQYFQLFFQSASSADIAKLPRSYPLWSIYNMMSDLYESTYDLESALDYAKKAAAEKRRLNFISPYDVTHTGKILLKILNNSRPLSRNRLTTQRTRKKEGTYTNHAAKLLNLINLISKFRILCVNNTSICKMVTHMQSEIYSAMYRMICKYGWGWGMTCNIINRQYGTNYTVKEFKELFRRYFLSKRE